MARFRVEFCKFSDGTWYTKTETDFPGAAASVANLYIPSREHHLHGEIAPPTRAFSTTFTVQSTTLYNEDGTHMLCDYFH